MTYNQALKKKLVYSNIYLNQGRLVIKIPGATTLGPWPENGWVCIQYGWHAEAEPIKKLI